jgi:5-methylcytosine-specific restriction protein A
MIKRVLDAITGKAPLSAKRSGEWPRVRKEHLSKEPLCAVCGSSKKLQVHHIRPFHLAPELELAGDNLITLCESYFKNVNCHSLFGHFGRWTQENPNVRADAADWLKRLSGFSD